MVQAGRLGGFGSGGGGTARRERPPAGWRQSLGPDTLVASGGRQRPSHPLATPDACSGNEAARIPLRRFLAYPSKQRDRRDVAPEGAALQQALRHRQALRLHWGGLEDLLQGTLEPPREVWGRVVAILS